MFKNWFVRVFRRENIQNIMIFYRSQLYLSAGNDFDLCADPRRKVNAVTVALDIHEGT